MSAAATPTRVAVFSLGGTIAAPASSSGAQIELGADDVVGDLAHASGVPVTAVTFRRLPSASLSLGDLADLGAAIAEALRGGHAAAVVTVGTDALEEVAFALDLLHGGDEPIVVTGAMRNAGMPGADGPANLIAALRVAASPQARGLGALVVNGDEVHLARWARKAHSSKPAAFVSENVGPVGWVVEGRVRIALAPKMRPRGLDADAVARGLRENAPRVALHRCALGECVDDYAAARTAAGVVVEAFGAGHVGAEIVPVIREMAQAIPVVFVSRTGAGDVYRSVGAFPGSERDLLSAGALPGDGLDGPKARVLLSFLLAIGSTRAQIELAFTAPTGPSS